MPRVRSQQIRHFILQRVEKHPADISKITADHFSISRQAVSKYLIKLTTERALAETGKTRSRSYKLVPLSEWKRSYRITAELAEDLVWTSDAGPAIGKLPENVLDIWHYAFTEMLNNAKDHSGGSEILVTVRKTAATTEMAISDNGIGIFKKIQTSLNLLDERHALFELSKGKLTTDPAKHTGEGIFFTSRMFDSFDILSGGVFFSHSFGNAEDWLMERDQFESGTTVWMKLDNHTTRTVKKIFDHYTSDDGDYGFNKTVVPVKLAQYGNDKLISRSQAKRVLARVELFQTVIFDFAGVTTIGQAFADEIFRVFSIEHPHMELREVHANSEIKRMISRARSNTT